MYPSPAPKQERIKRAKKARLERDFVDLASVLACYLRADAMRDYLDRIVGELTPDQRLGEHRWIGASAMFYASMGPLIEAWEKRLRPIVGRHDELIDELLRSPVRDVVFRFRNSVWHFQRFNDDPVLKLLENNALVELWVRRLHEEVGHHLHEWRDELVANT